MEMKRVACSVVVAVSLASQGAAAAPPETVYSGGPYRPNGWVHTWIGRDWHPWGIVIGDFAEITPGTGPRGSDGHVFRYHALVAYDIDDPSTWGVAHVGANGRVLTERSIPGAAQFRMSPQAYRAHLLAQAQRWAQEAMQCSAEGRRLAAQAAQRLAALNQRNDASRRRLLTPEGWRDLALEMALDVGVGQFAKAIRGPDAMRNALQEMLLGAGQGAAVAGLPTLDHSGPPEAQAQAMRRMLDYAFDNLGQSQSGRHYLARFLLEASQQAAAGNVDARAFVDAAEQALIDVGFGPVAPLAREALELAKQFDGYVANIAEQRRAGERLTCAINAMNNARAARDAVAMLDYLLADGAREFRRRHGRGPLPGPVAGVLGMTQGLGGAGNGGGWNGHLGSGTTGGTARGTTDGAAGAGIAR